MKHAFTLIELLVVIAIIALLSTLSVIALNSARVKARDARRISDIRTIRTALDMYYNTEARYPAAIYANLPITSTAGEVYLTKVPTNPSPFTDNGCPDTDYVYTPAADFSSYTLTFCLGNNAGGLANGSWVADASGYTATSTPGGGFVCGVSTVIGQDSLTYGTVTGADTKCWLDRNLGATQVATAYNDTLSYGYLYQWGRTTDGHQIRTSATINIKSTTDTPGSKFIISTGSPYDWRNPKNDSLWQGVTKSLNNPCPSGFRLPTQAEWQTLISAANITNYTKAFDSTLKLTAAGVRDYDSGNVNSGGIAGEYWSSTPKADLSYLVVFFSSSINANASNGRGYGLSVRCIKEVEGI